MELHGTMQKKFVLRSSQKSSNALELNSGSLLVFLLQEMEFRGFLTSAEWFGMVFQEFMF
jgi:hypothetical protein